jgi:NAD+ synthase (glutamine-hydrolysing)
MKIALAQINTVIGDFNSNINKIISFSDEALKNGCDLCIFPEMSVSGYPPRDFLENNYFVEENLKAINKLTSSICGIAVIFGAFIKNTRDWGKPLVNAALFAENGILSGTQEKKLLPTYDIFDELRYFEPGIKGDPLIFKGKTIGLTVCEDIWYDNVCLPRRLYGVDPICDLMKNTPDFFVNISSSPYELSKYDVRKKLLVNHAKNTGKIFIYVNNVGGKDSLVFDGNSLVVSPEAEILAHAKAFEEDLIYFDLSSKKGDTRINPSETEWSLLQALSLCLRDYTKSCGFTKAVIGLSGGIDSALTATIARIALGRENVLGVIMPSPFTSQESIIDAQELAKKLGISVTTIPITPMYGSYLDAFSRVFQKVDIDLTTENLQARIRGNILMAISNKMGHLVLSTGNKSEMAVGYCTLYGDLVGGFALLSDIPKTMVYKIARYINQEIENFIPERCFAKAPSAELRPDQKDEDDLPPYNILDQILYLFIEKGLSAGEIILNGFEAGVVKKVINLVRKSEYKRQQAPIGPKVTSKAFGYGRRYPLSHNFREFDRDLE